MKPLFRTLSFLLIAAAAHAADQPAAQPALDAKLRAIVADFRGDVAMSARDLASGKIISINGDRRVKTASTIKVAVMTEAFWQVKEGKLHLDDLITLAAKDRVAGSGILQDMQPGLRLVLEDAITLMIVESDNSATNLVLEKVGIPNVNARMASLGLKNTKVFKKVFVPLDRPLTDEEKEFGLGVTTPNEMLRLLEMIEKRQVADAAGCDKMIAILKKQRDLASMQRLILGEPKVSMASKSGALEDVRNDVGLIYTPSGTIAFAAFAYNLKDHRWTPDNEGHLVLSKLARAVYDAWAGMGRTVD